MIVERTALIAYSKANINGTILDFTGPCEAETSYSPPFPETYSRFIYGFATVGPFDFVFWHVAPPGEPTKYATIGYLSENGQIILNACNTISQRPVAITKITPSGSLSVPGLPFSAPQLLQLDFIDRNGKNYSFLFNTDAAEGGTLPIGSYATGEGSVVGGLPGVNNYSGTMQVQYFVATGSE